MLTDSNVQAEIIKQTAAILTPEQVKEKISALSDSAATDSNKLRALELMGKVHALFIERNINDNLNRQVPLRAIEGLSTEDLADELVNRLRLSSSGISPQAIDTKQDA